MSELRPSGGSPNKGSGGASPSALMGLGFQFVASIFLFLYLGKWLDSKLGTQPWLLLAGVAVGAGAGFYAMLRQIKSSDTPRGPTP